MSYVDPGSLVTRADQQRREAERRAEEERKRQMEENRRRLQNADRLIQEAQPAINRVNEQVKNQGIDRLRQQARIYQGQIEQRQQGEERVNQFLSATRPTIEENRNRVIEADRRIAQFHESVRPTIEDTLSKIPPAFQMAASPFLRRGDTSPRPEIREMSPQMQLRRELAEKASPWTEEGRRAMAALNALGGPLNTIETQDTLGLSPENFERLQGLREGPSQNLVDVVDAPRKEFLLPAAQAAIPGDVHFEDIPAAAFGVPGLLASQQARQSGVPGTGRTAVPESTAEEIASFAAEAALPGIGPVGGVFDANRIFRGARGATGAGRLADEGFDVLRGADEATDIASGGVRATLDAPMAPGKLPPPSENSLRDLSVYSNRLYRETDLDEAAFIIDPGASDMARNREMFFANTPDLARGQGGNRGVLIEIDTAPGDYPLQGFVNTSKPGWDFAWREGQAEFITRYVSPDDLTPRVRSFTVLPDAQGSRAGVRQVQSAMADLEKKGWQRIQNADGSVTMRRPDEATDIARGVGPGTFAPIDDFAPQPLRFPEEVPPIDEVVEEGQTAVQKLTAALKSGTKNIKKAEEARRGERASRIARADEVFEDALERGLSRQEAFALSRAELRGELTPVEGVTSVLTEDEKWELFDTVRRFDFGFGEGRGFASKNAIGALLKMESGQPLQQHEINLLARVFGDEFKKAAKPLTKTPLRDQLFDIIVLPKAVKSAFDMSYPLRQGIMLAPRRSKEFLRSFKPMIKAFGDERFAQEMTESILSDQTPIQLADGTTTTFGEFAQNTGLLRTLDPALETSEEAFRSQLAERIPIIGPIVRASNRAFTSFGNVFRTNVARQILKEWGHIGDTGKAPVPLTGDRLEGLSRMLNRFTGRGTVADNTQMTQLLQATWWSPQYRLSGPQAFAQMFHKDPKIRSQAIQNIVSFVSTGATLLTAAKLSGVGEVIADPLHTDFGRIRMGDTRYNFWGTNQVLARTIARMVTGQYSDPNRGSRDIDRGKVFERYFRSGLAPEWGVIWDQVSGEDYLGNSVRDLDRDQALDQAVNLFAPLIGEEVWQAIDTEGWQGAPVGPIAFFGGTIQSYEPSAYRQLQEIPEFTGGLTTEQIQDIKDFHNFARKARQEWELDPDFGPDKVAQLSFEDTLKYLGEKEGKSENFIKWSILLRPGSRTRAELRNPAWVEFAAKHWEDIYRVDENRYPPRYIDEAIAELRQRESAAP